MTDEDMNEKMLSDLGEVKGMLRGVTDMIRQSQASTNRRIDDVSASLHGRLDMLTDGLRETEQKADRALELSTDTAARFDEIPRRMAIAGGIGGGGVGGIVVVGIALIRHFLGQ
jgi:hypothetical protein